MLLKSLWARLMVAVTAPVVIVTVALLPILSSHLDEQVDSTRLAAETLLTTEYNILLRSMNESFNQVLATAEFPLLSRFLDRQSTIQTPAWDIASQRDHEQLQTLITTLLTHFGRYTRLAVIDADGQERVAANNSSLLPRAPVVDYSATSAYQKAMALQSRDLYVSPPRLGASRNSETSATVTAVIDIATPVVNQEGTPIGVLLFTLDWSNLTTILMQDWQAKWGQAILVDALGQELLLNRDTQSEHFGLPLENRWPDVWKAMSTQYHGVATLANHLLAFRTHDIRIQHYHSQAGMILSEDNDTQPWRLGILMPRPTLTSLLWAHPVQLLAITLVYLLAIGFGLFWVLSNHRLRGLRQRALMFSRTARQYAGEVQDLYEHAPCGYHSLDSNGRVVRMNRTELTWLGYRVDEVIDRRYYREFVTLETQPAFDAAFQKVLGQGQEGSAECELLCRDGTRLPVAIQATAHVTNGGFQYTRATVFDLSERKQLEKKLEQQALTDPLTELGNRRYMENQATMEIARAARSGASLTLIVIDLDHFKRINDSYGHDVGDLVLQAFATTARSLLRDGDVLCRMGGEEFAVLLPDTTQEQAMQVAERLRETVAASPAQVGQDVTQDGTLAYTVSLGVTQVYSGEPTLKPAFKRSDQGLYAAKAAGRNRTHWQPSSL